MANCQCSRASGGQVAPPMVRDRKRGIIIWRRDSDFCAKPQGAPAKNVLGFGSCRAGRGTSGVWAGLCGVSGAGGNQPECLRFGDRESLHRGAAEEWKDDADVRSATALDLRERAVPASGVAAVLVSDPASGSADRYLGQLSRSTRERLECCVDV